MYEKAKLAEANFFFSEMRREERNPTNFKFHLSAFLSASRTVLQYTRAELEGNIMGIRWYDNYLSTHPILGFFRDKRDVNIHFSPSDAKLRVNAEGHASIGFSASVRIVARDKDGNVTSDRIFEDEKPKNTSKEEKVKIDYFYRFDDWIGNEDIMTLSQKYLKELEKFVDEAQRNGYITI